MVVVVEDGIRDSAHVVSFVTLVDRQGLLMVVKVYPRDRQCQLPFPRPLEGELASMPTLCVCG